MFKFYKYCFFYFLCILSFSDLSAQVSIIPQPASVDMLYGNFVLNKSTSLVLVDDILKLNQQELTFFNEWVQAHYGFILNQVNTVKETQNVIQIRSEKKASAGYELNIQPDKIMIKASGEGLKNAFESLKQLMHTHKTENRFIIPSCFIIDSARFQWRGMHLDVSRHFFDKTFIKKYIDYISMYKMNVFHWHLTDDQGWRIEIKKYPELTAIGSKRKGSMVGHYNQHRFDTLSYGGFYTQEEIKEIVAYAKSKHVTIVPEIEMPGHALAALAAYPQFACAAGPFEVEKQWGVFEDVFCPKPETFAFLEDVLTEVMALFPGEYIHVGGDECPKERWKTCTHCQHLINQEGLKDEHELQAYFIQRIEKFLNKNNKKLIGWDEILEGGLAQNAAVMSWRGIDGGIAAAKLNHYVVMTPGTHCYFDHYQGSSLVEPLSIGGFTPLEKVYVYNPVPSALNENESKFILGAQANIWTEYITSSSAVEYFALPRMAALSEVLWTPEENKNLTRFLTQIQTHFTYLDLYKTNYAQSIYTVNPEITKDTLSGNFSLRLSNVLFANHANMVADSIIFSDTNGKITNYKQPVPLHASFKGFAQFKRNGALIGNPCPIEFNFNKATGKQISFKHAASTYYNKGNLTDGMRAHYPRINNEWLAWSGKDMEVIVDLASEQPITSMDIGFLKNENDWIYLPSSVLIAFANDTSNFMIQAIEPGIVTINGRTNYHYDFSKVKTRYIKITAVCAPKIEQQKNGAGEHPWLFVDEIEVN